MKTSLTKFNSLSGRRPFGKGAKISIFTLGAMRAIGSLEQMYSVVKTSLLAGINHIETAEAYGDSEHLLGQAIKKLQEEGLKPKGEWVITSKLLPGISFIEGKEKLKNMLKKLSINRIDNLAIHGINLPEHLEWALDGDGADILEWAKEKRLIKQAGFSSHGSTTLIREAIDSSKFNFCSLHLHLLDQRRIPIAKIALNKGMGVMAISPIDKGGKLQQPSDTLIRDCHPIPPIELAYKFLLEQGISTLTLGAEEPKDIELAAKIIGSRHKLNEIEKEAIVNLKNAQDQRLGESKCGQCDLCTVCPKNVPIPELLHLRNLLIGHDLQTFTKERYNLIGRAGHWWESIDASGCEMCGECIPLCPNNLKIPDLLKELHTKLKASPRRRLWS